MLSSSGSVYSYFNFAGITSRTAGYGDDTLLHRDEARDAIAVKVLNSTMVPAPPVPTHLNVKLLSLPTSSWAQNSTVTAHGFVASIENPTRYLAWEEAQ